MRTSRTISLPFAMIVQYSCAHICLDKGLCWSTAAVLSSISTHLDIHSAVECTQGA
jgi:hypothetical protein